MSKVLVNEGVNIAELQFDGGAHVVKAHNLREVIDDLQAPLQVAQVVVGQLQHE
jgi:hypothetical protein